MKPEQIAVLEGIFTDDGGIKLRPSQLAALRAAIAELERPQAYTGEELLKVAYAQAYPDSITSVSLSGMDVFHSECWNAAAKLIKAPVEQPPLRSEWTLLKSRVVNEWNAAAEPIRHIPGTPIITAFNADDRGKAAFQRHMASAYPDLSPDSAAYAEHRHSWNSARIHLLERMNAEINRFETT